VTAVNLLMAPSLMDHVSALREARLPRKTDG
jgi:hypothetical protein